MMKKITKMVGLVTLIGAIGLVSVAASPAPEFTSIQLGNQTMVVALEHTGSISGYSWVPCGVSVNGELPAQCGWEPTSDDAEAQALYADGQESSAAGQVGVACRASNGGNSEYGASDGCYKGGTNSVVSETTE